MDARYRYALVSMLGLLLVMAASPAAAEEGDGPDRSVGLGVDLALHRTGQVSHLIPSGLGGLGGNTVEFLPAVTHGLRLPIRIGEHWYLEPTISGQYSRSTDTYRTTGGMEGNGDAETTEHRVESRNLTLDVSLQVSRSWEIAESTRGYAGGQIGVGYRRATSDVRTLSGEGRSIPSEREGSHLMAGPVVGAEHFVFPALSLGLEAHLVGRVNRTETEQASEPSTSMLMSPGGSLIVRTYF